MSTPKDESEKKLATEDTSLVKEASVGGGGDEADGAATGKPQRETAGGGMLKTCTGKEDIVRSGFSFPSQAELREHAMSRHRI